MEYPHDVLLALRNHYAGGTVVLPAFLPGVVPLTSDDLALVITKAAANGRCVVVSPRLISGLSTGDAADECDNSHGSYHTGGRYLLGFWWWKLG
mmetsp:Transcript_11919/g.33031  ORF Transcript_11919/g.33031 Transcript_11919/m.33031 type:complete len:94 (+) Transcript_11919:154-435(+)